MLRQTINFILRSRLEDVLAAGVSLALLVFFLTNRLFHSFAFGMQDLLFILLPVGILGVKCLLGLLFSGNDEPAAGSGEFLTAFFRPLLKIFRDWFPFLVLSAGYYSLYSNLILRVNPHTADATLAKIDSFLLGGHEASFLLEPWCRPWATDFLNLIYFSYVLFLPGVVLYFYLKKQEKAFRRIMMGYLALILMGVTSYVLVPAIGPESFFADQYKMNLQGQLLSRGVDYIIQTGRVGHDCFPSLHVGIPLLLCLYLRNYRNQAFPFAVAYVACMCVATIYLRYHYLIDVLAAFVYAPTAYWLNDFMLSHWPGERILNPAASTPKPIIQQVPVKNA